MSDTEKAEIAEDITTLDSHMPVPPADGIVTTMDSHMPAPPAEGTVTTMDSHMPAPPALDLDGK
ncbi:sigma-like protein [Streptomyces sp. NPDC001443]